MNDTDKLIAAIFAATMTARQEAPKSTDFLAHYDACVAEILKREALEVAAKAQRTIEAHAKAWG
jgi:hypothetical protein